MVTELISDIEVRRQSFTAVELLDLVENLHVREELRKYQPQYNYVFVGLSGQVEGVVRAKRQLTPQESREAASATFPGAAYFVAKSGMFQGAKAIEDKLRGCAAALQNPSLGQSVGDVYLKIDGIWVPSVGTLLLREAEK
jgi:hypothetical protein